MRRLLLVLTLLALSCGAARAEGMTWGIKGGLNLADLTGDGIAGNEMKLAFGGGVFFNYALTEIISVQSEALFMMKGTKSEVLENTGIHLTYIDIPFLAKFSIPTELDFVPYVFAGPSFSILMTATEESSNIDVDIKDLFKSVDYCLVFGTGFDYTIGDGRLLFDVRYSFGLTTIVDEDDDDEDGDVKNTDIIFMVGYGYSF